MDAVVCSMHGLHSFTKKVKFMANLDELIDSLLGAASSDLEALPLISSNMFPQFGEIYVGCYAKWLHEKKYLTGSRVQRKTPLTISENPSTFSREAVNGVIFAKDIDEEAKDFSIDYIRNNNLFLDDFVEVNINRKNKNIEDQIPDNNETYKSIAEIISWRFNLYNHHDVSWLDKSAHYSEIELNGFEKTEEGWIDAIARLHLSNPKSEAKRLADLNKLWALIDYSPNVGTEQVLEKIMALCYQDLGEGGFESVRNAIADFPFTLAIRSIFMPSVQLEQKGRLDQLLSNWSELNDDQATELENEFDKLNPQQKGAIFSSIRAGLRNADAWAWRWDDILSN